MVSTLITEPRKRQLSPLQTLVLLLSSLLDGLNLLSTERFRTHTQAKLSSFIFKYLTLCL